MSDPGPRPLFSPLLKTKTRFAAKEPHVAFGHHWRELLLPVGAIRVMVNNGAISSVKNVLQDDAARLAMLGQFTIGARTSIFQLVRGEFIAKVEVRTGADYFHAIRFHTNKRVSPWVGKPMGVIREIGAPEGFAIHSLWGSWGHGLRELGALFRPLSYWEPLPSTGCHTTRVLELFSVVEANDYRAPFTVTARDLGAIVVSVDPDLKWLRLLSHAQLTELGMLQGGVYASDGEHWLQLMDGERITGMTIVHDGAVVKGISWITTLQTTPWLGQYPTASLAVKQYECEPHERLCGFHGSRGRVGITALSVVVEQIEQIENYTDRAIAEIEAAMMGGTGSEVSDAEQWDVIQEDDDADASAEYLTTTDNRLVWHRR